MIDSFENFIFQRDNYRGSRANIDFIHDLVVAIYSTLIGITDKIAAAGQNHLLRTFVIYYFQSTAVKIKSDPEDETVYSALCKHITSHVNYNTIFLNHLLSDNLVCLIYYSSRALTNSYIVSVVNVTASLQF